MNNIKQWFTRNWTATKVVAHNVGEFVDALCLTAVSGYAIYESLHHTGVWYFLLKVAGLLIAFQAFVLLVKHFNKPTLAVKK